MDKTKEKSKASASSLKRSKGSTESINKCDRDDVGKRRLKKQKRKRHRSSSSSSNSSSTEIREKRHKSKKSSHHKLKRKSKKSHKRTKCDKVLTKRSEESIKEHCSESDGELIGPSPAKMCTTIMKPMSKEDWEKQQSVMRHVYDSETGRHRLIKGDGEVMEEIVSYKQHQTINKKATKSDGESFQAHLGLNNTHK